MKAVRIAIDPGQSGAMAIRWDNGTVDDYGFDTESDMVERLQTVKQYSEIEDVPVSALLERVASRPKQGVSSVFKFGTNYGFWRGALQAAGIPFTERTPQQWQTKLGGVSTNVQGPERKRKLKQIACERFPGRKVTLKNADALLMLEVME